MKALSFLAPVLKLVKKINFIYRAIGIIGLFSFFSSNFQDLLFLSTSNNTKPITIEEVAAMSKSEIPRYLRLESLVLIGSSYVVTENEETGQILDASYPVYSLSQLANLDTLNPSATVAHVIVKDKDFDESIMGDIIDIDGMYDNKSFGEVKKILVTNGIKVSDNAILIVKEKPPAFNSVLLWTILTGLGGLLLVLSFIPGSSLGIKDPTVPPTNIPSSTTNTPPPPPPPSNMPPTPTTPGSEV